MFEPELRGERMVRDGSDDAVFEGVAGLESEDAHRFHAHVVIRGSIHHSGTRAGGEGGRRDVRGAGVRGGKVSHRCSDRLERAVESEAETQKRRTSTSPVVRRKMTTPGKNSSWDVPRQCRRTGDWLQETIRPKLRLSAW